MKKVSLLMAIAAILIVLPVFGTMVLEFPIVMTSAGQSDEINTVIYLADEVGLKYDYCDILSLDEFKAGVGLAGAKDGPGKHTGFFSVEAKGTQFKTFLIAIGASLKGMGASGLSVDDEVNRIKALIAYAEEKGIKILGMAIGGEIRRGLPGSLNEIMIDIVAEHCDVIVVTSDSNLDKRFTNIAKEKNIEFVEVESAFDLLEAIPELFGL
ncbi:MAG TPA: DUF6305 family protein [Thermotogota bacterium]|nr:DUF6305 family protein [Thermotogota bacterium]